MLIIMDYCSIIYYIFHSYYNHYVKWSYSDSTYLWIHLLLVLLLLLWSSYSQLERHMLVTVSIRISIKFWVKTCSLSLSENDNLLSLVIKGVRIILVDPEKITSSEGKINWMRNYRVVKMVYSCWGVLIL